MTVCIRTVVFIFRSHFDIVRPSATKKRSRDKFFFLDLIRDRFYILSHQRLVGLSCQCNICRFEHLCYKKKKKKICVYNLSSSSRAVFCFIWLPSPRALLGALCSCRQRIHVSLCHLSALCCLKSITNARGMPSCRFAESHSLCLDGHWTASKSEPLTRWSGRVQLSSVLPLCFICQDDWGVVSCAVLKRCVDAASRLAPVTSGSWRDWHLKNLFLFVLFFFHFFNQKKCFLFFYLALRCLLIQKCTLCI